MEFRVIAELFMSWSPVRPIYLLFFFLPRPWSPQVSLALRFSVSRLVMEKPTESIRQSVFVIDGLLLQSPEAWDLSPKENPDWKRTTEAHRVDRNKPSLIHPKILFTLITKNKKKYIYNKNDYLSCGGAESIKLSSRSAINARAI